MNAKNLAAAGTLAVLCFLGGRATASGHGAMSAQTKKNLDTALHGEAFAYAKYHVFAEQARSEGHPEIAKLFEQTANEERLQHFREESQLAGLAGDTVQNLENAIAGENYEIGTMYRQFEEQARAAGDTAAAERFAEVRNDERKHSAQFQAELERLRQRGPGVGGGGARMP